MCTGRLEAQGWEGAEQAGCSCTIPATNWVQLLQKIVCQHLLRPGGHRHDCPTPQLSLLPRTPRRKECVCPQGDIYRIMHSSLVYNSRTVGTTEMSTLRRTDKCSAVYSHPGEPYSSTQTLPLPPATRTELRDATPSTGRQS